MAYYGMIVVMVATIIWLFLGLNNEGITAGARVTSIIISIILVLIVLYMTASIYTGLSAYPVGYLLFITSIATVILSFVFAANLTTTAGIIALTNLNIFLFVVGNMAIINLFTIAIYVVGLYIKQPAETTRRINSAR